MSMQMQLGMWWCVMCIFLFLWFYNFIYLLFNNFTYISTANKGWSTVIYCQSSAFDCPYLSCNDHCDWWLFQETYFFINITFIFQKFFWTILKLFSWNSNTFKKHKEKVCTLFACCFAITLCNNALHLLHLGWFVKKNP